MSSYGDSISTQGLAGKSSDAPRQNRLDSHIGPHSPPPGRPFILSTTEEHSLKISPRWDMSRWDLLPPPEELSDAIVKDSKYTGAPIFGLEKPIYHPDPQVDLAKFGGPMNLGDDCGGEMNGSDMQRIDASVAAFDVAPGADGIAWDLSWLDEVDLSNTDLPLDDVDLSGFDFPGPDGDILMDPGPHFFA
ncbi:hypothetical protein Q9L58_003094 [Maublancomyces gigas]|uniref:Uncharacterized protein n=1 Tax=Discina gigas TaxID=1032678 RepID=A0ABR3GPN4_9PEZI